MINKLRKKISLIILVSISIPILFIIIFSVVSYYKNTIRSNTMLVERIESPKEKDRNIKASDIDGIYSITIKKSKIISSDNSNNKLKEYALKISNKKSKDGIIGEYIYKTRKQLDKEEIVFIESTDSINKIKLVIITSILGYIVLLILIYIISKKIAKIITKPVEDAFNKQIEFISDASHELKTPLAVIQANADVLESEIKDNKWLGYIQNETENMSKLINEMLLLTKIENVEMPKEEFNLSEHIELITSSFESMAYEKSIKITTNIQENINTKKLNKEDIQHILSTLIDNAIKHTKKGKKVIIDLKRNKENITIKVKNEGEAIPISLREKIFERFYRVDKSRNRDEKRYGLGLAIAKSTVLKNNGTIRVDCNEGITTFTVKLPM